MCIFFTLNKIDNFYNYFFFYKVDTARKKNNRISFAQCFHIKRRECVCLCVSVIKSLTLGCCCIKEERNNLVLIANKSPEISYNSNSLCIHPFLLPFIQNIFVFSFCLICVFFFFSSSTFYVFYQLFVLALCLNFFF